MLTQRALLGNIHSYKQAHIRTQPLSMSTQGTASSPAVIVTQELVTDKRDGTSLPSHPPPTGDPCLDCLALLKV